MTEEEAFFFGFMISCEGFNGECMFDSAAPNSVDEQLDGLTYDELRKIFESNPDYIRLRDEALVDD